MSGFSKSRRKEIFNLTEGKCFYCGQKLNFENFHIDHFTAKAKGGGQDKNMVPACQDCNLIKGMHSVEEFRKIIGNYLHDDVHVRMIDKYMTIKKQPIIFYFEKENINIL